MAWSHPTQGRSSGQGWGSTNTKKGGLSKSTISKSTSGTKPVVLGPTSSNTRKGGHVSSYDKAWHPDSWYAPRAQISKPTPVTYNYQGKSYTGKTLADAQHNAWNTAKVGWDATHEAQAAAAKKLAGIAKVSKITQGVRNTQKAQRAGQISNIVQGVKNLQHSGGGSSSRGGSSGPAKVAARPATTAKPIVKPAITPVVPAKKVAAKIPAKKAVPETFTRKGVARKFGKYKVKRANGPRHGLSMTPELLQAAARQRIVNYH